MFDPFDERLRDKIKRRKPEEVVADKRNWCDRIDNHFRRAMDELEWPDYVDSECIHFLIDNNAETNLGKEVLKCNFRAAMDRLGYEKFMNEKSKDGRWKFGDCFVFVYSKRGSARIGKLELKHALER